MYDDLFTMYFVTKDDVHTYRIQYTIDWDSGEVRSFIDKPCWPYLTQEEHRDYYLKEQPWEVTEVKFGLQKSREPEFAWSVVWNPEDLYVREKLEKVLVWETKKTWNRAKPVSDWF